MLFLGSVVLHRGIRRAQLDPRATAKIPQMAQFNHLLLSECGVPSSFLE